MKVAIPVWGRYVSTVFDFSDCLLIINVDSGQIINREAVRFVENTIVGKATRLRKLGVQVLLCGAISRPLHRLIETSGIKVIPFLKGTSDEIFEAYLSDRLPDKHFVLPGCSPDERHARGKGMRRRGRQGRWGNAKKGW
jgi:predicted Fe-Mo cluster-binding NifX family protein